MQTDRGAGLAVIINGSGGRASRERDDLPAHVSAAFAASGVAVDPVVVPGKDLDAAIQASGAAQVVVVGGGDGTLGSAAAQLAATGQTMAILPLGTLNHLSTDLQITADLVRAARIAVSGRTEAIDLAEVNGTVFVNNASIGLYARMVRDREARKLPKWLATVPAAFTVLKGLRHRGRRAIEIEASGRRRCLVTPLLFVGNNHYAITGADRGRRSSLQDGTLAVYVVKEQSAAGLILFALRALIGRADPSRDFVAIADVTELTVLGEGAIPVAHDGEVTAMQMPLRFKVRPRALKVRVP